MHGPQPSVLALSELLIVLMNILVASRNGSSELEVWFQGFTQWPEIGKDKEKDRKSTEMVKWNPPSLCVLILFNP